MGGPPGPYKKRTNMSDQHNRDEHEEDDGISASTGLKIFFGFLLCLVCTFFYTMLPIAGLQFLPVLAGCILFMTGVADEGGFYD